MEQQQANLHSLQQHVPEEGKIFMFLERS